MNKRPQNETEVVGSDETIFLIYYKTAFTYNGSMYMIRG